MKLEPGRASWREAGLERMKVNKRKGVGSLQKSCLKPSNASLHSSNGTRQAKLPAEEKR